MKQITIFFTTIKNMSKIWHELETYFQQTDVFQQGHL